MSIKEVEPLPILSYPSLPITRWWSEETVAVVTGGNKGIGFALVKRFAELGLTVILTARNEERGLAAVESLGAQGLHVYFRPLDVSDAASIHEFASWFRETFGALDILVNNAAVSFKDIYENSVEQAEVVIKTNFYGPKLLTEALLPLLRRSSSTTARILNLSSRLGLLKKVKNPQIKEMLEDEANLSEAEIEGMVGLFMDQVKEGTWKGHGWPEVWTDYAVSKLALNAYSKVLAKRFRGRGLSVNCYCPGFTQTSMTRGKGTHTADASADLAARLALLPLDSLPTGEFFLWSSRGVGSRL